MRLEYSQLKVIITVGTSVLDWMMMTPPRWFSRQSTQLHFSCRRKCCRPISLDLGAQEPQAAEISGALP